jgi:hypothetical protein
MSVNDSAIKLSKALELFKPQMIIVLPTLLPSVGEHVMYLLYSRYSGLQGDVVYLS